MKEFKLRIVTPERTIFEGDVTSVTVPGSKGSMGILYNHAPLVSSLETGEVVVHFPDGKSQVFVVSGGFVEVANNDVRVLADVGEPASEIDEARAREAAERAKQRIRERKEAEFDLARAEAALSRAMARLRVAQRYKMPARGA